MKIKIIFFMVTVLLAGSTLPGCDLLKKKIEKKENVSYTLNGLNKNHIRVENINGEIRISKSQDTTGKIIVNAEKIGMVTQADKDKQLEGITINIDTTGNSVKISSNVSKISAGIFEKSDTRRINFEITIPANMKADVENTNGAIILTALTGDIKVESVNGSTSLIKCSGNVNISGTNGSITGNFDSTKGINIDVVNGAVKLGGLKNISAQVNAKTENGKIKYNNLTFSNLVSEKHSLNGTLGNGGNLIKISSVNGSITLDANDVSIPKQWHSDDMHFKFDFDDDDDSPPVKNQNNSKNTDTQKAPESPKAK